MLHPTYMDVGSAELRRERSPPTPKDETYLIECHPGTWPFQRFLRPRHSHILVQQMCPAANAARAEPMFYENGSHFLLGSTTLVTGPLMHILCSAAFVRPCTSESDGSFHN